MSNQRIVNTAYFTCGVVVFVVMDQLLGQVWTRMQLPDGRLFGPVGLPLSLSVIVAFVGMVFLMRHERVNPFLLEVVTELREVTWPTRQETTSHTTVVIVAVMIVALLMGAFDFTWATLTRFLLNPPGF